MWFKILFIGVIVLAFFSHAVSDPTDHTNFLKIKNVHTQYSINEQILAEMENGYNPIPSPDGKMIAFVRTGWGREGGSGGFGRSNLISEVSLMDTNGNILNRKPLANAFLAEWTSDGKTLICFRDRQYFLVSTAGVILKKLIRNEEDQETSRDFIAERASYLSDVTDFIWTDETRSIKTTGKVIADKGLGGEFIIPSPNGRYIATVGNELNVYDRNNKTWASLGKLIIHPDREWDYIKPSWNPWFSDSSKLVFVSDKGIVVSSPDGKDKKIVSKEKNNIGIPTPSPDGKMVAYVSFEPRPMKIRPDLKFYGGTTVWVIKINGESNPKAITNKNEDETYCLRWLGNKQVVFDRVADEIFYKKARLWKADIPE